MIGKYPRNQADIIFEKNIGKKITVELIPNNVVIHGILESIGCNTLIIKDDNDFINMCRYEDLRFLI